VATLARAWIPAVGRRQLRHIGQSLLGRCLPAAIAVLVLTASAFADTSPVLEEAAMGIETHRKGDATIRVVRKDGTSVPAARVEVVQRSHDFLFGNVFRPCHYDNEQYRTRFLELFNFVQLLEFNWGQYEREEGQPQFADRMAFINGWCREHGLTRFYGHMLVWTSEYEETAGWQIPRWLFKYDKTAQYGLLKKRIECDVAAYKDIDIVWDVVNEPVHTRVWGDWDKDGYVQNRQAEPIERILPYVEDSLTWAHAADPRSSLLINDYRVVVKGTFQERYKQLLDALQAGQAPLTAVGIQAHEPYKGAYWFSPEEIWEACELFGTRTGLPIHFTEFCYSSDSTKEIRGTHRHGKWSPELQADAIEEFYRVAFGHPAVESIFYFGMGDDEPLWLPKLGLLDEHFQPKPAWNRLRSLIKDEWTTRRSGTADATGTYAFRGFFGSYDVRVTGADRQRSFTAHLEKGKPNVWSLTLE